MIEVLTVRELARYLDSLCNTAKTKKMAISGASNPSQPSTSTAAGEFGSESDSELQESVGYRTVYCETLGEVVKEAYVCSLPLLSWRTWLSEEVWYQP